MPTKTNGKPQPRTPSFEPVSEIIQRVIENVEKRTGSPELPTGLRPIDKGTFGLHPTHLMVISGRPGTGKTSLCLQIAHHLASHQKRVAFFSLEMSKETLVTRLFSQIFGVCLENMDYADEDNLRQFKDSIIADMIKFGQSVHRNYPLHIVDDLGARESDLYNLMDTLNYNPEVIIFDHIQQIKPGPGQRIFDALDNYLRYMKEIAMRKNIACLVVSQINRQGEERATLANLKGSGSIEELSDEVFICSQVDTRAEDKMPHENFCMALAKNRFGSCGKFYIDFEKPFFRFV